MLGDAMPWCEYQSLARGALLLGLEILGRDRDDGDGLEGMLLLVPLEARILDFGVDPAGEIARRPHLHLKFKDDVVGVWGRQASVERFAKVIRLREIRSRS